MSWLSKGIDRLFGHGGINVAQALQGKKLFGPAARALQEAIPIAIKAPIEAFKGKMGESLATSKLAQEVHAAIEKIPGAGAAVRALPVGKLVSAGYDLYNAPVHGDTTDGAHGTSVETDVVTRGQIADATGTAALAAAKGILPGTGLLMSSPVETAQVMDVFAQESPIGDFLPDNAFETMTRGSYDVAADMFGTDAGNYSDIGDYGEDYDEFAY